MEPVKLELEFLKEKNGFLLYKNLLNDHHFMMMKSDSTSNDIVSRKNFKLYLRAKANIEDNEFYQALEMLNFNHSSAFVNALFNFVCAQKEDLAKSIQKIENFFSTSFELTLQSARGVFAELFALLNVKNLSVKHENAIYDFSKDNIDFEVKSFSKVNPVITISLQQATNSKNAIFGCYEIFESEMGQSIIDLYNALSIKYERYDWITKSASEILGVKFAIGKTKEINIPALFKNISLPKEIKDASFKINIEDFLD